MNIEIKQKRLDRIIILLAIFLSATFLWRCLANNCTIERKLPEKFAIPVKLFPDSDCAKLLVPTYNISLARRKNAHYFFLQACLMLDAADFSGAQQFVNQAIAEDPGNRKYHKMFGLVAAEIANRSFMDRIVRQMNTERFDQAWGDFVIASQDNYLFFSRYAEEFSGLLKMNNQIASSASIMMAIK